MLDDPVLIRFRAALDELYGSRVERVVLCGSRARGDADGDSDYDIAVFLRDFHGRWREMDRIIPVVTGILYDDEAFIHAMPFRAGAYRDRTPLMREIRREGVDLTPEAADHLEKARHCLSRARVILASEVPEVAAREGYLAAFHAA